MPVSHLRYKLVNGYITNWLVAGPQSIQIPKDIYSLSTTEIARTLYSSESGISQLPVEQGPLTEGTFTIGDFQGIWKYFHCDEDRFIDFSDKFFLKTYQRAWAFTELNSRTERTVVLNVTVFGPVDIWLNENHTHRGEDFSSYPIHQRITIKLNKGINSLLLRLEQNGSSNQPFAGAVRLSKSKDRVEPVSDIRVRIPTTIPHMLRRIELERAFSHAFVRRDIFSLEDNSQNVEIEWPPRMSQHAVTYVRLQSPSGRVYALSEDRGTPGDKALLGFVSSLQEGAYNIQIIPSSREYYDENIRVSRSFPVWVTGKHAYSELPYGNYQSRKAECLLEASRRNGQLHAEIAKMEQNSWGKIDDDVLHKSIQSMPQSPDSLVTLTSFLGMLYRYGGHENFPTKIIPLLEKCIVNFPFDHYDLREHSEGEQILLCTCKILAGQKYPRKTFPGVGVKGRQLRLQGEQEAINWLYEKGNYGFSAWDSDEQLANTIVALSHLVDLDETESVFDLAGVLLDKILVGMAINSYQGVLASASGQGSSLGATSALTKATAGISRLFWGQGIFNHHISGYVSSACMKNYELPSIIADIANSKDTITGFENNAGIKKTTYRTADFMLSSVVDYKPGERGDKEIMWQATIGTEAIVFVNHPGSAAKVDTFTPNFWLGNAVIPQVAQYKDALITLYNLPPDDWMGFTHAYFPLFAFDEYKITRSWAFARKGDGYLAITASGPINMIETGAGAYREIRCTNPQAVWVCQLGSLTLDGEFSNFKSKVLNLPLELSNMGVHFRTLRDDNLYFKWSGEFHINDQAQVNASQYHYQYPFVKAEYPCHKMEVEYNNYVLRLDFHPED